MPPGEKALIRIVILFPNQPNKQFDLDYYRDRHLPQVKEKYAPFGLRTIEHGIPLVTQGKHAAPYIAVGHLVFDSIEQFLLAYDAEGATLMADMPNFTDILPVVQISHFQQI